MFIVRAWHRAKLPADAAVKKDCKKAQNPVKFAQLQPATTENTQKQMLAKTIPISPACNSIVPRKGDSALKRTHWLHAG